MRVPASRSGGRLHDEVRHVHPAGIVLGREPVAPEAELRAHPQFGLRLEAALDLCKPLSVKAVAEPADGVGHIPFHGLRPDVQLHPDDDFGHIGIVDQRDILRLPAMRERFVPIRQHGELPDSLGGALIGLQAFDIVQDGALSGIGQAQAGVVVPHHGETGLLAPLLELRVRPERELRPDGEPLGRELLRQEIRAVPQAPVRPGLLHRIQPYAVLQRIMPIRRRQRRILPFQADAVGFVTLLVISSGGVLLVISSGGGAGVEKSIVPHRLPHAVSVGIHTDERPAIGPPGHRLEVQDAPVGTLVLEMEEPVLPVGGIHPGSLMGTIDGARRPGHDDALLVGAERVQAMTMRSSKGPNGLSARRTVCQPVATPPAGEKM